MMGTIIGALVTRGWSQTAARAIAYVGFILLLASIAGAAVLAIRHDAVSDDHNKTAARALPATNQAASERANDAIAGAKHEEELHNAVHSVPDTPPGGPSHALACKRLRDLGRDPPSCR